VLLDSVSRQRTLQSIAIAIGQRLADKARFRKFNDENPALFQVVSRDPQSRTSNLKQKRRVLIHTMRQKSTADWEGWSKVNKLHLGQRLIDIVMSTVGLVSILHPSKGRGKSVIYVQPTAKLVDLISERNGQCELLDPVFVPMVVPPKSWSTPHDGGYWFSNGGALVKHSLRNWSEDLGNLDMPNVYTAINVMQETAWKVNQPVLVVMKETFERGAQVGKVPEREPLPAPTKPTDIATNADARKAWKRRASIVFTRNTKRRSSVIQMLATLRLADEFSAYDRFYYPGALDSRGRAYTLPSNLTPQGTDCAKALLMFANGKPIEEDAALGCLMIHGAKTFRHDKRIAWVAVKP